jgi:hypothetical protein
MTFIFEDDVNVPSKSNKQKKLRKKFFFVGHLEMSKCHGSTALFFVIIRYVEADTGRNTSFIIVLSRVQVEAACFPDLVTPIQSQKLFINIRNR